MSSSWKSKIPKVKKKLKNFLTDESGKITKKDALWISAAGAYIAGLEEMAAAHTSNITACGHINQAARSIYNSAAWINETLTGHSSGIITGTYSHTPNWGHLNATNTTWATHTNQGAINATQACHTNTHSNHSNHSSGGWC